METSFFPRYYKAPNMLFGMALLPSDFSRHFLIKLLGPAELRAFIPSLPLML